MSIRNPSLAITLLALAGCHQATPPKAAPSAAPKAAKPLLGDSPMYLYHGVQVIYGTNNVDWSRTSFGISGPQPSLTFFNSTSPMGYNPPPGSLTPYSFPCWIRVAVVVQGGQPGVPAAPGATATLATPNPGAGGASPGPWTILFDNNPVGHWSIAKTTISSQQISNAAAGTMAGLTFQGLVANGTVTVQNGSNQACTP